MEADFNSNFFFKSKWLLLLCIWTEWLFSRLLRKINFDKISNLNCVTKTTFICCCRRNSYFLRTKCLSVYNALCVPRVCVCACVLCIKSFFLDGEDTNTCLKMGLIIRVTVFPTRSQGSSYWLIDQLHGIIRNPGFFLYSLLSITKSH